MRGRRKGSQDQRRRGVVRRLAVFGSMLRRRTTEASRLADHAQLLTCFSKAALDLFQFLKHSLGLRQLLGHCFAGYDRCLGLSELFS